MNRGARASWPFASMLLHWGSVVSVWDSFAVLKFKGLFWPANWLKQDVAPSKQTKDSMVLTERGRKSRPSPHKHVNFPEDRSSLSLSLPLHFLVLHPCAQHLAENPQFYRRPRFNPRQSTSCLRNLPLLAGSVDFPCVSGFYPCTLRTPCFQSESTEFRPPAVQETSLARWIAHVSNYRCPPCLRREGCSFRVRSFHSPSARISLQQFA